MVLMIENPREDIDPIAGEERMRMLLDAQPRGERKPHHPHPAPPNEAAPSKPNFRAPVVNPSD